MQQIEMPKKSEGSNAKEDFLSNLLSQETLEKIKKSLKPEEKNDFPSNKTLEEIILLSKVIQDTTKTLLEWGKNLKEQHILEKNCISALREEATKKLNTLLNPNFAKIREIRREATKKNLNGTENYDSKTKFIGYSEKEAYPEEVSTQGNSKPKLKLITNQPATDSSNTKESHEDTLFSNLETKGFEITIKESQLKPSFWEVRKNNLFFTLQNRKYIDFPTLKIITQDLGLKKVIERKKIEQDVIEKLIDAVDKLANTKEILSTEEITIILFYFGVTEPTEKMLDQRYLPFGIIDESFYSTRVKIKRNNKIKNELNDKFLDGLISKGYEIIRSNKRFDTIGKSRLIFYFGPKKSTKFNKIKIKGLRLLNQRAPCDFALFTLEETNLLLDAVDKLANTEECLNQEEIKIILLYLGIENPTDELLNQKDLPFSLKGSLRHDKKLMKKEMEIKQEGNEEQKKAEQINIEWWKNLQKKLIDNGFNLRKNNSSYFDISLSIKKDNLVCTLNAKKDKNHIKFPHLKKKYGDKTLKQPQKPGAKIELSKIEKLISSVEKLANSKDDLDEEEIRTILVYFDVENPTEELLSQKDLPFSYITEKKAKRKNDLIEMKRNTKKEWTKTLHHNLAEKGFLKNNLDNDKFSFKKGDLFLTINHNISKNTDFDAIRIKGLIHKQKHSNLKNILNPVSLSSQKIEQLIYAVDKLANTEQELNETEIRVILDYFGINNPDQTLLNPKNLPFRHKQKESIQSHEDLAN